MTVCGYGLSLCRLASSMAGVELCLVKYIYIFGMNLKAVFLFIFLFFVFFCAYMVLWLEGPRPSYVILFFFLYVTNYTSKD